MLWTELRPANCTEGITYEEKQVRDGSPRCHNATVASEPQLWKRAQRADKSTLTAPRQNASAPTSSTRSVLLRPYTTFGARWRLVQAEVSLWTAPSAETRHAALAYGWHHDTHPFMFTFHTHEPAGGCMASHSVRGSGEPAAVELHLDYKQHKQHLWPVSAGSHLTKLLPIV